MKNVIALRDGSLERIAPEVWAGGVKDSVYIGAKPGRHHYLNLFVDPIIVEPFPPNARGMRAMGHQVTQRDVRWWPFTDDFAAKRFRCIFWWHGPEHVEERELDIVLPKLEAQCDILVLGCPWGRYEQGAVGGNRFEHHLSHLTRDFFESRGYTVDCVGIEDQRGSHITSVKRA